jgi:hypothetical protein
MVAESDPTFLGTTKEKKASPLEDRTKLVFAVDELV